MLVLRGCVPVEMPLYLGLLALLLLAACCLAWFVFD